MQSNQDQTGEARSLRDRVVIFDTTLRDGEQCPGATMTFEEKLEVAEVLDEMGVDIIEAGFPIASEGDFNSVQEIARRAKKAVICGLARAHFKDIDRCAEAIKPAKRGRIHTFIGTSPLHRKYQMGIDEAEVLERVTASVTRARTYTDDVEWSAMDATRTEHDFLCRCVEAAIKAGATTVNIPDTVGYATPDEFAEHEQAIAAEAQQTLEATRTALGLPDAEARIIGGSPGPAICGLAEELGAAAIVMGTRGHGGIKRAVLGSVADHVTRNAPCPVVVGSSGS